MDLARYIASDDCPRDALTIPHEDVSLSNYVYSYTNNSKYHRKQQQEHVPHDIQIISVNTSRIMLTTSVAADWHSVNLMKNPELYSTLLWGHSIKRGNHTRFLVWKKDKTFKRFWEKFVRFYVRMQTMVGHQSMIDNDAIKEAMKNDLLARMRQKMQISASKLEKERMAVI
mmetsp:Transcript_6206/g.9698  ORF Transcript_6206/g.9698 Transcript_6206/m.9698 type:complete len:171 (-) Transcript_6206:162-674(-)